MTVAYFPPQIDQLNILEEGSDDVSRTGRQNVLVLLAIRKSVTPACLEKSVPNRPNVPMFL